MFVLGLAKKVLIADTFGIAAMLRYYGMDPAGKPCYVLGSGGTSHTTCATLRRMGAASVTVVSRKPGEGQISYEQLAEEFRQQFRNRGKRIEPDRDS